jgi:hypothetical protein
MNLARVKLSTQSIHDSKQSLFHRPYAGAEVLGDFLTGQSFLVLHDEHQPLTGWNLVKTSHDLLHHNVVERRSFRTCNGESVTFRQLDGRGFPTSFVSEKGIHHDSSQPGVKGRLSSESCDRPIGVQENLLHEILRVVMVATEPQREGVHCPLMTGY